MSESTIRQEREKALTKSILRTLEILDQFATAGELGIKELGKRTTLPASTVQRIINTLESKNYLKQNPDTYKYRLGMAFFNLSGRYGTNSDWSETARGHIEALSRRHRETVNLAVPQGHHIVFLAKAESPHILRPCFPVGTPFTACNTALGRCILAHQNNMDLPGLLAGLEDPTEKTITDPARLEKELEKVRANGYAMEDEEYHPGLFCIAAPVRDNSGRVIAAVSMSIPKLRLDITALPALVSDIISTADTITADIKGFFSSNELPEVPAI